MVGRFSLESSCGKRSMVSFDYPGWISHCLEWGNFQKLHSQESGEQPQSAHFDSGITPVVRSELVIRPVGALDTDDMCFFHLKMVVVGS